MGILAVARTVTGSAVPVDVVGEDPLWGASDDAAFWQSVLEQASPEVLTASCWGAEVDAEVPDTRRGQLEELRRLAGARARAAAREARLLIAIAGVEQRSREVPVIDPQGGGLRSFTIVDEVIEEVSVALRRSVGSVRRDVAMARSLAMLPLTADALAAGVISPAHAEAITRVADGLPDRLKDVFERQVVDRAARATSGETASFARRLRARLDAAGEEVRRRESARLIDVRMWAEDDGLACLQARLPLADAARVHAALEARARAVTFDPDESMGERRAAALVAAVCDHSPSDGGAGRGSGAPGVAVSVLVDAVTLMGLQDGPALVDLPGEGRVPVTAQALRDLLADPSVPVTLRRLLVDPMSGDVVDRGRTCYRLTDDLREFVNSRDGSCRFPHCRRSARQCDIDHVVPWDQGGGSDRVNLMPLCRRHHILKTHGSWTAVHRRADGAVEWRAPDGSTVVSEPWTRERRRILEPWDPLL